jgi:signal transduction histidine kinase
MDRIFGSDKPNRREISQWLWQVILLAIVYHLAARVGLSMAYIQSNTSPVWPPTGIALAALLILGLSRWPGITLGVLLGSLLTGAPFTLAFGMAIGNTLEALVGAFILQRLLNFNPAMNRIQDITGLAVVAIFSTMISATVGATTLVLTQLAPTSAFTSIWVTWWVGDLLGALVVATFILTWAGMKVDRPTREKAIEGALAFLLLGLVTWYVFIYQTQTGIYHQALLYLIFPFTIWTAIRFGQRGGTTAVLVVSGMAIWVTVAGLGPFSLYSKNDNLILLQTFLGVVSITSLILAAATTERLNATHALQRRADDLAFLNESSRIFLNANKPASIYQTISDLTVSQIGLDAAWIERNGRGDQKSEQLAISGLTSNELDSLDLSVCFIDHNREPEDFHVFELEPKTKDPDNLQARYTSLAIVPLIFSGALIGNLNLLSKERDFFSTDRQLLIQSYANLAAVVIQNSWLFEEVRSSNRQLHGLSQRLIKAQEEERLNLSRELHDESGQLLAALLFELGVLERSAKKPSEIMQKIQELKGTAHDLQENLHQLAVNLRPASLDHLGLVTALEQFVHDFSEQYNIRVEFEAVGMQNQRLSSEAETAIYRIVQESLTNVALHARASLVDVLVGRRSDSIIVTIEDNGVGFLPTTSMVEDQLGLFGMRERVQMLNGRFTLETAPGKGTTVNAEIPCNA